MYDDGDNMVKVENTTSGKRYCEELLEKIENWVSWYVARTASSMQLSERNY